MDIIRILDLTMKIGAASFHDVFDINATKLHLLVEIFGWVLPARLRPDDVAGRNP